MLSSRFLKLSHGAEDKTREHWVFKRVDRWYTRSLVWSLDHPSAIFATLAVAFALVFPLNRMLGRTFIPSEDMGEFQIHLDTPEGTVATVPPGVPDPAVLAAEIAALADDPGRRERIGAAAREHMRRLASTEATAHGYAEAIRETLAIVEDPVGATMRRWADALADVGVGEPELARGFGLGYARALETFTHPS